MDDCIFCKIISGDIPSFKVWENDDFLAFLSIAPLKPGHTLVIPKNHVDYFFDMDDQILAKLLPVSKPIAKKIVAAMKPKTNRAGLIVAGLEVPHAHLHVVPMDDMGDLDFKKAQPASQEELDLVLKKIKEQMSSQT